MAKTDFQSVDEYIASFPPDMQGVLRTVREALRQGATDAEEVISYQVPALKYHGWVFYFAGFKNHFSLSHPPPCEAFEAFSEQLARYKQSKSAIQFPLSEPVPVDLIRDMAAYQAAENARAAAGKPAKKQS